MLPLNKTLDQIDDQNEHLMQMVDIALPELIAARDRLNAVITEFRFYQSQKTVHSDRYKAKIIMRAVLDHFALKKAELVSTVRDEDPRMARQVFLVLCDKYTGFSYTTAGKLVNRTHATVIHSLKVMSDAKATKNVLWDHLEIIEQRVKEALLPEDQQADDE